MIRIQKIVAVLVVLSHLSFGGCRNAESLNWAKVLEKIHNEFPEVKYLSTKDLAKWIEDKSRKSPLIFDTRKEDEYLVSHLQNAKHLHPMSDFVSELKGIRSDAPIVVYCSVGYRSSAVARELSKLGYTNVSNLDGSIFKWANEGRKVVCNKTAVLKVHPYDSNWGQLLNKEYHP